VKASLGEELEVVDAEPHPPVEDEEYDERHGQAEDVEDGGTVPDEAGAEPGRPAPRAPQG
jgi:hypothetical protein